MLILRSKGRGKEFGRNKKQRRRVDSKLVGWRPTDWWHWAAGIARIFIYCFYLSPFITCIQLLTNIVRIFGRYCTLHLRKAQTKRNLRAPTWNNSEDNRIQRGFAAWFYTGTWFNQEDICAKSALHCPLLQEVTLTESSNKYRVFCSLTAVDPWKQKHSLDWALGSYSREEPWGERRWPRCRAVVSFICNGTASGWAIFLQLLARNRKTFQNPRQCFEMSAI